MCNKFEKSESMHKIVVWNENASICKQWNVIFREYMIWHSISMFNCIEKLVQQSIVSKRKEITVCLTFLMLSSYHLKHFTTRYIFALYVLSLI